MVYLIPIFLCLFFSIHFDQINGTCVLGEYPYSKRKFNYIFIWLVIISALQYSVGYDIPIYMDSYNINKNMTINDIWGDARYRPGWLFLQFVCHRISDDFVVLKIIQAIFLNFCVYKFLSRYSKYWYLTLFFYILYSYGQLNFGAMRQSFAVGFFLLAVPYLEDQTSKRGTILSLSKYFFLVYLATLFHTSAFILLILPVLKFCVSTDRRIVISILVIIIATIVLARVSGLNTWLYSMIASSDDLAINATYYLTGTSYESRSIGFATILAFFPIYLCLYLSRYLEDYNKYKVIRMMLLAYIIMATLNISIPIFYRFNDYFVFAYIIFMPITIYKGLEKLSRSFRNSVVQLILFVWFILFPVNHLVAVHPAFGFPGYRIYYPYYSVFNPQVDQDRNRLINANINQ